MALTCALETFSESSLEPSEPPSDGEPSEPYGASDTPLSGGGRVGTASKSEPLLPLSLRPSPSLSTEGVGSGAGGLPLRFLYFHVSCLWMMNWQYASMAALAGLVSRTLAISSSMGYTHSLLQYPSALVMWYSIAVMLSTVRGVVFECRR